MKIDFQKKILGFDGNVLKIKKDQKDEEATLGAVAIESLVGAIPGDNPSGMEKLNRWKIAQKISLSKEEVELSVEEVASIKTVIGLGWPAAMVGPCFTLLDGNSL